jgi:hypothetical protein
MTPQPEIDRFLTSVSVVNIQFFEILSTLRNIVIESQADVTEEVKYGGICFFDAGLLVGGIFPRKKHISFEFSEGGAMDDPDGLLEGSGKFRRHLKLRSMDDIEEKKVSFYVDQAFHKQLNEMK